MNSQEVVRRDPPQYPKPEPEGSSSLRLGLLVALVVALGILLGRSAVVVVLSIVLMIFMHELGHYLTARAAGMKVTEFFIGFGPEIWSFRRGEVNYGLKAIPAGAYVKVVGMTNLDEVDPVDEDRTYRQKPYWRRLSVALAGSGMHFLMAAICLFVLLVGFGIAEEEVWEVGSTPPIAGLEANPAAEAGLREGDKVLVAGGAEIVEFSDLQDAVAAREPGDVLEITAVRPDGTVFETSATLVQTPAGAPLLGVTSRHPPQTVAVLEAVPETAVQLVELGGESVRSLARFFSPSGLAGFFGSVFETAEVDTSSEDVEAAPGGEEDEAAESGERVLSIYGAARIGTELTDEGAAGLLAFLVLINVFVGVFNLVPLLPLDGGHVAVATYEKVRELLARSHARYHADAAKLLPITYVVIFLLMSIGVAALYLDIADPVELRN